VAKKAPKPKPPTFEERINSIPRTEPFDPRILKAAGIVIGVGVLIFLVSKLGK